jgi:ABC-type ATPase with predicted acetyltransferase domain
LTLSLTEIGRAAGIDEAEVRRIVLSMVRIRGHETSVCAIPSGSAACERWLMRLFWQIETGEIDASIDAHGSVTFTDDEPTAVSKAEVDRALRVAQEQEQVLRRLEREIARNKDYLQKVRGWIASIRACRRD